MLWEDPTVTEFIVRWLDGGRTCTPAPITMTDYGPSVDFEAMLIEMECQETLPSYKWIKRPWWKLRFMLSPRHLWDSVSAIPYHTIIWPWQRMRRGWADADARHAEQHLACITAGMIGYIRANGHGYQPLNAQYEFCEECDDEHWKAMLETMQHGFERYCVDESSWSEQDHTTQALAESLRLYAKFFEYLWM